MATGATIYRAALSIADVDRSYYGDHALTVARHPSETEERLMVRLFAFALFASDELAFGRGLSTDDEPDLWQRDRTGEIARWIGVGLPDPKWLRKACARSAQVVAIAFGRRVHGWWARSQPDLTRFEHLTVLALDPGCTEALAALASRSMKLDVLIQNQAALIGDGERQVELGWRMLQGKATADE